MTQHEASRTLLKSPPELWAECSDAQSLARHLEEHFGEIRISRLEPEHTVAWEGERGSGTVKLKPSDWGTKVTLTAATEGAEPVAVEPVAPPTPEPPPSEPEPVAPPTPPTPPEAARVGFMARMLRLFNPEPVSAPPPPQPAPVLPPEPPQPAEPAAPEPNETTAALSAALDSLGKAHHRPYSRA
jgi:hypothetical protein